MIKGYETKKLRLNSPLRGKHAGEIVRIRVDKNGVPIDAYWRNRLKDADVDGCVEFYDTKKRGKK